MLLNSTEIIKLDKKCIGAFEIRKTQQLDVDIHRGEMGHCTARHPPIILN